MLYPDDLLPTFDAQWPDELAERNVRAMEEGRALLVDYFPRHGVTWPRVRFVKDPFRLELGRYVLVGTPDRVDELPDGTLQVSVHCPGRADGSDGAAASWSVLGTDANSRSPSASPECAIGSP